MSLNDNLACKTSELFSEYLGVALVVIQRFFFTGQIVNTACFEAKLLEPMRRLRGENEQFTNALLCGTLFNMRQHFLAALATAIIRMYRNASKLANFAVIKRVQRGATHHHAVTLNNGEAFNFIFQQLAGATYQHARTFQRLNQLKNTADIFDISATHILVHFFSN